MNIFALKIWYDEGERCTFYSVSKNPDQEDEWLEADLFFETFTQPGHPHREAAFILFRLITETIGNRYGAIDIFFDRRANRVQELPPKPKAWVEEIRILGERFPLRLFCLRISEQIVILFGGGIKHARTIQECPDLYSKFLEAIRWAQRIEEAIREGMIIITDDNRHLQSFDGKMDSIIF